MDAIGAPAPRWSSFPNPEKRIRTLATTLNDTLGIKREIRPFDFSIPYWEEPARRSLCFNSARSPRSFNTIRVPPASLPGDAGISSGAK